MQGSRFFQAQKFWDNYEGGLSYFGEELWGDGGWYMNKEGLYCMKSGLS